MKKFLTILLLFIGSLVTVNLVTATDLSDEIEVKIFQISFEENVNQNFDDLLLRKTDGFLKYQWEPEGLYIVMETTVTKSKMNEALQQLNFTGFYKISKTINRVLPIKALKE